MATTGPPTWATGAWGDSVWAAGAWDTDAVGGAGAGANTFVDSMQTQWVAPHRVPTTWATPHEVAPARITVT
jgi:hypothetical protein